MMRLRSLFAAIIIAMLAAMLALASIAHPDGPSFPKLIGRVVDEAGILSPETRNQIAAMSAGHEHTTGQQIVVVTVKSLQGYSIEQFGYQLGRYWGIGQKVRNNGALLIVAPNERKVRIEVGYGLEGTLTDAQSRVIIEQSILPAFRRGDFNGGVLNGIQAMLQVLGGNPISAERPSYPNLIKGAPLGAVAGLIVWCLFFFGAWGFFSVTLFRHRNDPHDWVTYRGGSGWSSGSSGGGGSDSGGGFSGGGGSFGGGGASGSW